MSKALRGVAQEIGHSLVREMGGHRTAERSTARGIVDLLLDQLAEEVVRELTADLKEATSTHDLEARLGTLETRLHQLDATDSDDDEADGHGSRLSNLKYAKPKYKDVQSILKYIERDQDNGGVKLVIMNFND